MEVLFHNGIQRGVFSSVEIAKQYAKQKKFGSYSILPLESVYETDKDVSNSYKTVDEKIQAALDMAENGSFDGAHHKMWVIDQMVRILADDYEQWVKEFCYGECGPNTYEWDTGIEP